MTWDTRCYTRVTYAKASEQAKRMRNVWCMVQLAYHAGVHACISIPRARRSRQDLM